MNLAFRDATLRDLPTLVEMLARDPLGARREAAGSAPRSYEDAFEAIRRDPHNQILIAEEDGVILAFLQLTFIPNLTYQGAWRAQIEGVRVRASARGGGVGSRLVEEAVDRARARGCGLVQLTTDKQRDRALVFYERLGFVASHEGLKLKL